MAAAKSASDKDDGHVQYDEELQMLAQEVEGVRNDHDESLSDVLRNLNKSLTTMATSLAAMERAVKRSAPIETSDSEATVAKKQTKQATKRMGDDGHGASENIDSEALCKTTKEPLADSAIEGKQATHVLDTI